MHYAANMILLAGIGLANHHPHRQGLPGVMATLSQFPTAASPAPLSVSTVPATIPASSASGAKCGKGYTYCGFMLQSGGHSKPAALEFLTCLSQTINLAFQTLLLMSSTRRTATPLKAIVSTEFPRPRLIRQSFCA